MFRFSRARLFLIAAALAFVASPGHASRPCEVTTITGGGAGLCVVRHDGRVACWGDENYDWPLSPRPVGAFAQVSVGAFQACGVRQDGTAACWGKASRRPFAAPQGLFRQLSVGASDIWGVRTDGSVEYVGEQPAPAAAPGGPFLDIEGACGRRPDRTVECWDQSIPPPGTFEQLSGQCGLRTDGSIDCWGDWSEFVGPLPSGPFTQLSLSYWNWNWNSPGGCAIEQDGAAVCWGGHGDETPPAGAFREVAIGAGWPCGIRTDGSLECWPPWPDPEGGNTAPLVGEFTQISAGGDPMIRPLSCAIDTAGRISCWGNDGFGQASPPDGKFTQVSAGPYHACGIRGNGSIQCWGHNDQRQLDAPSGTFRQISSGGWGHNCALRDDGTIACWGYGNESLDSPTGRFVQVTAGGTHACALDGDGDVACWNYDGDFEILDVPAGPFVQISASGRFAYPPRAGVLTCGLRPNGSIECWGDEVAGELDPPSGPFVQVSAGAGGACGLRASGEITCWGSHWDGILAAPEGRFVQVATGYYHACGLTADGTVVCSGEDQTVSFCGPSPLCGNAVIEDAEECDDGNVAYSPGNACTDACSKVPCGQPVNTTAQAPRASDALFTLRAAVGPLTCELPVCDVNRSSTITVIDALAILQKSVGTRTILNCS